MQQRVTDLRALEKIYFKKWNPKEVAEVQKHNAVTSSQEPSQEEESNEDEYDQYSGLVDSTQSALRYDNPVLVHFTMVRRLLAVHFALNALLMAATCWVVQTEELRLEFWIGTVSTRLTALGLCLWASANRQEKQVRALAKVYLAAAALAAVAGLAGLVPRIILGGVLADSIASWLLNRVAKEIATAKELQQERERTAQIREQSEPT